MNAARQLEPKTIEDVYRLPDGQRAERIDGEPYALTAPGTRRLSLVMALSNLVFNCVCE